MRRKKVAAFFCIRFTIYIFFYNSLTLKFDDALAKKMSIFSIWKLFVHKTIFSSHSFNKTNDFVTIQYSNWLRQRKQTFILISQCFENSGSCLQIKSRSDYGDRVSEKLNYLSSNDYTYNPVLFIISLGGSHFESRESIPISHHKNQSSIEMAIDISIFLGFSVLYRHLVKKSSIFV